MDLNIDQKLSKKLILVVVVSSAIVSIFITMIQMIDEYRIKKSSNEQIIISLINTNVRSLENSLWDLNIKQVKSTLEGLIQHELVYLVKVEYQDVGKISIIEKGVQPNNSFSISQALKYSNQELGLITIYSDYRVIYDYLGIKLLKILLLNLLKTSIVCLIIYLVFGKIIINPILDLVKKLKLDIGRIELERYRVNRSDFDEIDVLVDAINELIEKNDNHRRLLSKKVVERNRKLKQSNILINEALEMKKRFISNVSHELRTPMNGILGFITLIKECKIDEEAKGHLKLLHESADRMMDLVEILLDFEKVQEDKNNALDIVTFSIEKLNDKLDKEVKEKALKYNVEYSFEASKSLRKEYQNDFNRISRILFYLVDNAIKFSPKGKVKVFIDEVEFDTNERMLQLIIEDNGKGMDTRKINDIFKSFYQSESGLTRNHEGLGLGLTIVRSLISLLNGSIEFNSEVGAGTKIKVLLPADVYSKDVIDLEDSFTFAERFPAKVLIVEDNKVNQKLVVNYLSKLGYDPMIANNGRDAIELHDKVKFDVIIMDLQMPVMDGLTATKRIRSSDQDVVIIALTANVDKSDRDKCFEAGMDSFLQKPVKQEAVRNALLDAYNERAA